MTVYADVLFLVNFIINYILLFLTAKIARLKPIRWRLLLGAILGALYAVFLFFPRLSFGYTALAKFLFSLAVVALTYHIHGLRLYMKAVGIFYLVTFSLGGGVMALFQFTDIGASLGMVIKNGVFYMQMPWYVLLLAICAVYAVIRGVWGALQNRLSRENMYVKVGILWEGREAWMDALLDTGNVLCDPLSKTPVIIAEYQKLMPVLPQSMKDAVEKSGTVKIEEIQEPAVLERLRVIPFTSLGKEHGMLVGFRPDSAKILENEQLKDAGNVIVGIYEKPLTRDRSYGALLHPMLLGH